MLEGSIFINIEVVFDQMFVLVMSVRVIYIPENTYISGNNKSYFQKLFNI